MDYFALGKRLRKRRVHLGMTQEELAEAVGLTTSFVGHLERGTRKASLETLVALANAMNVSMDVLLSESLTSTQNVGGLSESKRNVMQEMLATMQSLLDEWQRQENEGTED